MAPSAPPKALSIACNGSLSPAKGSKCLNGSLGSPKSSLSSLCELPNSLFAFSALPSFNVMNYESLMFEDSECGQNVAKIGTVPLIESSIFDIR